MHEWTSLYDWLNGIKFVVNSLFHTAAGWSDWWNMFGQTWTTYDWITQPPTVFKEWNGWKEKLKGKWKKMYITHIIVIWSLLNVCLYYNLILGLTKWLTPEDNPPLGLNNLELKDIRESANYTCEAASALGVIEAVAEVKVQCKYA